MQPSDTQVVTGCPVLYFLGVDHGGDKSPQNLEWETVMQTVPPDFVI